MLDPASTSFRYAPFDTMRRMRGELARTGGTSSGSGGPPVNVWQSAEAAAVTAEIPGVATDALDISVKGDVLTLSGERKAPEAGERAVWHRRERGFGRFSRAVRLPFRVDPDRVEASVEHGIVRVVLHRRAEDMPRRIQVKSG